MIARLASTLVLALAAACVPAVRPGVIDGWPIGDQFNCGGTVGGCQALRDAAVEALALRDPGHAPIVSVGLYEEGLVRDERGEIRPMIRSGGPFAVAVISLADGSVRAIGVRFGVGGVQTLPRGPLAPGG